MDNYYQLELLNNVSSELKVDMALNKNINENAIWIRVIFFYIIGICYDSVERKKNCIQGTLFLRLITARSSNTNVHQFNFVFWQKYVA